MPSQGDLFETNFAREVIEIPVQQEMSESFLAYSLSVITSRAIPDVRDGLKPVQRRILYSMSSMGLRPDRPHRKCAGVVGDTMGKYHPHGDGSIYDALTRMGQTFSRNVCLVDPHGNFGTLDDPPAAYRYTECRLSEAAMELLAEIDEETVEFRATFDGEREEPIYLPARLPNLLVNGTTGIAVGMATNMPPHNLVEVYEAIKLVMTKRRPKPTVEELRAVLPGPDLPSGGTFRMRATAEIVNITKTRQGIVVTELPYMVGPERIVSRIQELVNTGKLVGVSDVKNLQDRRTGMNITIECKPGVNAKAILTELYRLTPMEESYGVNNVATLGVPGVFMIRANGSNGPTPEVYCTSKTTSAGCVPTLTLSGAPDVNSGSGFTLSAASVPNQKSGLLFYSLLGRQSVPFGGGFLCVVPPLRRTSALQSGGSATGNDCTGSLLFDFNTFVASGLDPALVAGTTVDAQFWFRDPGFPVPQNTGLTRAAHFGLAP